MPETVFYALRSASGVVTQNAFVNSSGFITFTFGGFVAYFVWNRCRSAGLSADESAARSVQVAVLALIAFLELPRRSGIQESTTLLREFISYRDIAHVEGQRAVLVVGSAKLIAWFYLYSLFVRYHLLAKRQVFARMFSVFPSSHRKESPGAVEPSPSETGSSSNRN